MDMALLLSHEPLCLLPQAPQNLLDEAEKLKLTLEQRMGILFDVAELGQQSDDEDAPVVIDI